jgi:hypothetical protein
MVNSEVMKNMTRGIVFLLVALATPVIDGSQPGSGVAEVDVIVKQSPTKRRITDERGNFSFAGLAPGRYTLTFRGRKADALPEATRSEVIVGDTYAIKIEGVKRGVNQTGVTSDRLIAGLEINVELLPGAQLHGEVRALAPKRLVWIGPKVGSNVPGRWVQVDSSEVIPKHNIQEIRRKDLLNR